MKKVKLFFSVLAMLLTASLYAQNINVSGVVKDASTGEPVPFAALQLKGTTIGTSTDVDGNFTISVPSNATLIFSSIGYISEEVAVEGRKSFNVTLKPDATALEEAVVIGYGSSKKVGNIVGSVATVKSDVVKNAPSNSALDQLQGKVAGMAVLTTGGVAGDNSVSIQIHGTGSLTSSTAPLYIIDGVPSSSRSIMALNPNDIASISVLKDAAATSIYGARAANGVVFVTTKSGSYDTQATVTVRSQYGISTLANFDIYDNMMSGDELKDFWVRAGIYSEEQIYKQFTAQGFTANTKWHKYYQQFNTPQYQNDISIEGGGKKVAYMVGVSQYHQTGTTIGNYFDKYTVRSNVQGHPNDWLKFGVNLNLSYDRSQLNESWNSNDVGLNTLYVQGGLSYLICPLIPAVDENGKEFEQKYPNGYYNEKYSMATHPNFTDRYGLNGGMYLEIEPLKSLKIRSQIGTDSNIQIGTATSYPSYVGASTGSRSRGAGFGTSNTLTNTIEYSFNIANDHHIGLLAGQEYIYNTSDTFSAGVGGLTDDELVNLQNGTTETRSISESTSSSAFLSFFGNVNYNYAGKYYIDGTVRNDACSRFGADKRNAWFWAAGLMWKISREDFLKNAKWINDLSFKASYGTQGNASIGNYTHLGLIGTTTNYGGKTSTIVGQPSNEDLTWEQQALLTVGISGRLWDRFGFDISFYDRKTSNMLLDVPYPYTSGFSSATANVGKLDNRGIDVSLDVDILKGADYYLNFHTVFNYNKEKIEELFNGRERWDMTNYGYSYVVGQPIMYYEVIYAGIDKADGLPKYYIPGENIDVTTKGETTKTYSSDLMQNTGLPLNAPVNGGFGLSGAWKGLSLNAEFSYVLGKTLINNDKYFYANPVANAGLNTIKEVSDFWTPDNVDAAWPDWSKGTKLDFSTLHFENASFLRLKQLQVGYSFPDKWWGAKKVVKGIKVTFTGRNLWTVTSYTGIDPEYDGNVARAMPGNTKQFLGGLEITF